MSDLSIQRDKALNLAKLACTLDKQEKYEEAYRYYLEAIEYFIYLTKCKRNWVI